MKTVQHKPQPGCVLGLHRVEISRESPSRAGPSDSVLFRPWLQGRGNLTANRSGTSRLALHSGPAQGKSSPESSELNHADAVRLPVAMLRERHAARPTHRGVFVIPGPDASSVPTVRTGSTRRG